MKDLLLFRLHRLGATAAQPIVRLCEGRYAITRREWRMIAVLSNEGPLLSSELARIARIEPARTSRAVTSLVQRGLATRVPRAHDRRYVEIHLTEKACAIYRSLAPLVQQLNEQLLSVLPQGDRAELERLVTLLEGAAETMVKQTDLPKADRRHKVTR
jgi:DNA-binding MarR family transcriptional regulator